MTLTGRQNIPYFQLSTFNFQLSTLELLLRNQEDRGYSGYSTVSGTGIAKSGRQLEDNGRPK